FHWLMRTAGHAPLAGTVEVTVTGAADPPATGAGSGEAPAPPVAPEVAPAAAHPGAGNGAGAAPANAPEEAPVRPPVTGAERRQQRPARDSRKKALVRRWYLEHRQAGTLDELTTAEVAKRLRCSQSWARELLGQVSAEEG